MSLQDVEATWRRHGTSTDDLVRMSMVGLNRARIDSPHLRPSSPPPPMILRERAHSPVLDRPRSPPMQQRHHHEQEVAALKIEMRKKDELIKNIVSGTNGCSGHASHVDRRFDISRFECAMNSDRHAYEQARKDMSEMQCSFERAKADAADMAHHLEVKDLEIRKLTTEVETYKESESRQIAIIDALKYRISDLESESVCLEGTTNRGKIAIEALMKENCELKERLDALQERLQTHLTEKEAAQQYQAAAEKRFNDLLNGLREVIHISEHETDHAVKIIIDKFSELIHESGFERAKVLRLEQEVESLRLEDRANRQTIERLVGDVGREQRQATKCTANIETLSRERDDACRIRESLECELRELRDRVESAQRGQDRYQRELEDHLNRASHMDKESRESLYYARNAATQLETFKEALASLLSDGYETVHPNEEDIKKQLRHFKDLARDHEGHIRLLEDKVTGIREQFEQQYGFSKESEDLINRLQTEVVELRDRVRRSDGDASAQEVMRDGLRMDRERYMRFLEQLSATLKMERISADIGLDMMIDAVLSRAEQLVKLESDALAGRSSQIYSLQRKMKSSKEQLDSKDLHLDLLRKKVAQLEERLASRNDIDRERDSELSRTGKFERLAERYKAQLDSAKIEIRELKAQLLAGSELRNNHFEANAEIERLFNRITELETVNEKQAKKITFLKREVSAKESSFGDDSRNANEAVRSLTDENRHLKISLDEARNREQELLDQRCVIGRMLGLDINNVAVPAFELIERLRRIIETSHMSHLATESVENLLDSMDLAYQSGYEKGAVQTSHNNHRQSRHCHPRHHHHHSHKKRVVRARSVSPVRRVDPRSY